MGWWCEREGSPECVGEEGEVESGLQEGMGLLEGLLMVFFREGCKRRKGVAEGEMVRWYH